jgi:MFS transporter, DHA1 family, tetracycline resistance protein
MKDTRTGRSALGILFLTVFLDLLGFGMIIPALGPFAKALAEEGGVAHANLAATSLGFIYSAMQLIFTPLWGRLSDRIGRRPVLLISVAGSVFGFAAVGLVDTYYPSFWLLLAARAFSGVMTSNISVAQAFIADVTPPEGRAKGMGLIGAAFGLGFVFGPFIGGELSRYGLSGPSFLAAGLSLINLAWAALALPEPRERKARPAGRTRLETLRELVADRRLALLLAIFFIVTFAFAILEQTFSITIGAKFELPPEAASTRTGRYLGLAGLIGAILQGGLVGRLVKRFGEARLIAAGALSLAAGFFLVLYVDSAVVFLVPVVLVAAGQGLSTPSTSSLFSRLTDPERQGEILGLTQSVGALARILGPAWGGEAFDLFGTYRAPYLTGALAMLAAFVLAARLVTLVPKPEPAKERPG